MHVVLMHNPSAGAEDHSAEELVQAIERRGHRVTASVAHRDELSEAVRGPCDLVAIAGGDGTVGKAVEALVGSEVPFTVLALGTANNIARTLRLDAPVDERIDGWRSDVVRVFDAAHGTLGDERKRFYEAIGFGAFPRLMHAEADTPAPSDPGEKLVRDLELFHRHVAEAPLERYAIAADGEDLSGDYLMIEVLNVPFIGPNILLAPEASPSDGRLDLVVVGRAERDPLLRALDRLRAGEDPTTALPTRRADRVVISGSWSRYHLDGKHHEDRSGRLDVQIERGALRVLAPA
jgi:diacylglycerol kinase family enzyme